MTDLPAGDFLIGAELLGKKPRGLGSRTFTVKLSVGDGEALLRITRRPRSIFAEASLSSVDPRRGALFWRELARWLGVGASRGYDLWPSGLVPVEVFFMDELFGGTASPDEYGCRWTHLKLFLGDGTVYAECYLNLSLERGKAMFREKDPFYREDLVGLIAEALGDVEGLPLIEPGPPFPEPKGRFPAPRGPLGGAKRPGQRLASATRYSAR
jgi:hypothetical protein